MQYRSRYEGDLVAKCYFAKHKLVWEVLDGALKNKIEIQWSDIVAIKANYSIEGNDSLYVVVIIVSLVASYFNSICGFYINDALHSVFSWQDSLFSLGRQIHNLGSIHCGSQHRILPMDKRAYTGKMKLLFLGHSH